LLQRVAVEHFPRAQALLGKANPQIGLLEHIEQTSHGPAPADLGLKVE
jgi:hypothetical protein